MKIKFIGTGSGKTSLKRFHSSFLIYSYNFNLLIDAGDGISKALLSQNISFDEIDGILISHFHPDHFAGLASLIVQMKLMDRKKRLKIYSHKKVIHFIKEFFHNSYLFEEKMDFQIAYEEFKHNEDFPVTENIKFKSRQNSHLDKYVKFDISKELNFICCSFYFTLDDKNLIYTGDIGNPDDLYLFEDKKADVVITETTHVTTGNIISAFRNFNPKKLYLTHIEDEHEEELINWKSSLPAEIRNKFEIVSDGMTISI